jgi:predicted MPP superfamily phosphohydrolase
MKVSVKVNKITRGVAMCIIVLFLTSIIMYNILDNNRIKVITQIVAIDNLPSSFEGFTILHISDLHGKVFGKEQEKLINIVNNCNYDMIAITGDMKDKSNHNNEALLKLLGGIKNKEYIFYVSGNSDDPYYNKKIKTETQAGIELKKKRCIFLDEPYPIKRGENTIWVCSLYLNNDISKQPNEISNKDIKIALSHFPLDKEGYDSASYIGLPNYDLVLAGHYHGGQWRVPIYGAVFIPNVNKLEFFPKQSTVSGLMEYGNYKQYVTRGLGASSKYPFLKFRLFNTPEINLITLVKEK